MTATRDRLAALLGRGERCDLAEAALAVARLGYPDLDPGPYLARVDDHAEAIRTRIDPASPPHQGALAAARYLFQEIGFRGNADDYYDPRNSYLNDVLDRRLGIPITLSVVLLAAATRLGLPVHGVGFPGHFLVRVDAPAGPLVLDPFAGGRLLGRDDLLARLRAFSQAGGGHPGSDLQRVLPQALQVATPAAIVGRMLHNLLGIHLHRDDAPAALATIDLLLVATPTAAEPFRLRGLLYERLECYASAVDDLRRYLALAPHGAHAAAVQARVADLETRALLH